MVYVVRISPLKLVNIIFIGKQIMFFGGSPVPSNDGSVEEKIPATVLRKRRWSKYLSYPCLQWIFRQNKISPSITSFSILMLGTQDNLVVFLNNSFCKIFSLSSLLMYERECRILIKTVFTIFRGSRPSYVEKPVPVQSPKWSNLEAIFMVSINFDIRYMFELWISQMLK